MKKFNSNEAAIAYGKDINGDFYKNGYSWEKIKVNGELIILCKDCREYQDACYGFFYEMINKFHMENICPEDHEWGLVNIVEQIFGCKFLDVYDEF